MPNQSIGTPRFYIDYSQLAKVKGRLVDLSSIEPTGTGSDTDINGDTGLYEAHSWIAYLRNSWSMGQTDWLLPTDSSVLDLWNFDYSHPTTYTLNSQVNDQALVQNMDWGWKIGFWDPTDPASKSLEWGKLISTTNWCGFFNHNMHTAITSMGGIWSTSGMFMNYELSTIYFGDGTPF